MFAKLIVDIAHSNIDKLFTYSIPEHVSVSPGHRVLVPFGRGNKQVEGFVIQVSDKTDEKDRDIKTIIRTLEPYTALLDDQLKLAHWMQLSYNCLKAEALRLMIPAQLRGLKIKEKQVRTLKLAGGIDIESVRSGLYSASGKLKSPKQLEILNLFKGSAEFSNADICAFIPGAQSAVTALIKKGVLIEQGHVTFRRPYASLTNTAPTEPLTLNEEQQAACEKITAALNTGTGSFLLHGVTGSGKTEVYMHVIANVINNGGGAIVLVPEISLTPQAVDRFRSRFGDNVAVLHSRLSSGERYDEWRRIRLNKAKVVVGARSAVFAPVEQLQLIIIDEEHESSYQSETSPRYNAIEVAIKRCALTGSVLVLGSATPSIATYQRALQGRYKLIELTSRIFNRPMPKVELVDMRNEFLSGNNGIFSSLLQKELKSCIDSGDQAILFINRRGYSTFVSCRGCGYVFKCPDCDVSLTYHKTEGTLKCHYCGFSMHIPVNCPSCSKKYIKYFGVGTQLVEEQLKLAFPDVSVLRMDTDTTRTKNSHYEILDAFSKGHAQVLIGTQMIAKGLDVPGVTLVGVIAADSMLHIPDYKSCERSFQLLTQVAGRAGRDTAPGRVVVQTYTPEHPCIRFAAAHDYKGFYNFESAQRKLAMFPPYALFVRVLFSGRDEQALQLDADVFAKGIMQRIEQTLEKRGANEKELLFVIPGAAPIKRKQGMYRYQVLIKLKRSSNTHVILNQIYAYADANKSGTFAFVEVNPVNMF